LPAPFGPINVTICPGSIDSLISSNTLRPAKLLKIDLADISALLFGDVDCIKKVLVLELQSRLRTIGSKPFLHCPNLGHRRLAACRENMSKVDNGLS
jgi:hypothetical protein